MRNKLFCITAILVVLSYTLPYKDVDPRMTTLYAKYMSQVESQCNWYQYYRPTQIQIGIAALSDHYPNPGDRVGYCHKRLNGYKVIIDETFWNDSNDFDRYEVLAHELTHCMFSANHSEDKANFMSDTFESHTETTDQVKHLLTKFCNKVGG